MVNTYGTLLINKLSIKCQNLHSLSLILHSYFSQELILITGKNLDHSEFKQARYMECN